MTFTLWGRPTSLCSQRILWCLVEAGLQFNLVLASAAMGPHGHVSKGGKPYGIVDSPEYRAKNPNGTVPTIEEDDGFILWESSAILSYLALKHAPKLYGHSHQTFGIATAWIGWCNEQLNGPLSAAVLHSSRLAKHLRDPSLLRNAEKDIVKPWTMLEAQLLNNRFVAGDDLTIADIAIGPYVERWNLVGLSEPPSPNIHRWRDELAKRDGFKRYVAPRDNHVDEDVLVVS